jgi:hypothetical protein
MDWRERVAEGLPTPRNDEPASLRQDILDELADHLDCALKRELTKNITPDEAVENVKRRFGDPRDLARRLWLDAMKDTLMSKRLTLAAMGLMFVMCLLLGWMAWTSQRASQEAAESIRKTNAELLEKLSVLLTARPAPAGSAPERAPAHFHLIGDDAKKSPARGIDATFYLSGAGSNLAALKRSSDDNGDLDFGLVPPGSYMLNLRTPWHESTMIPLELSPAFPITSPIVCPAHDWQPVDVEFDFAGLPSLKDRDALIVCRVSASASRPIGVDGYSWSHPNHGQPQQAFDVVLDPSGRIVYFSEAADSGSPHRSPLWSGLSANWGGFVPNEGAFQLLVPTDRFAWLAAGLKQQPQLSFYATKYYLNWIVVLLTPDIRRMAGEVPEPHKRPYTLQTWEQDRTPFANAVVSSGGTDAPALQPIVGRKNVWRVRIARDFADLVDRLFLSSASRMPDAKNATEAQAESKAGTELIRTLGIGGAVSDRTADGLTGLRLSSIRDNLPAKYAGLKDGDLLLGIDGWNVNNDRELGWASRGYAIATQNATNHDGGRASGSRGSLLALVRRESETMLFEVRPPGSPAPVVSAPNGFPGGRFRGRRPSPTP